MGDRSSTGRRVSGLGAAGAARLPAAGALLAGLAFLVLALAPGTVFAHAHPSPAPAREGHAHMPSPAQADLRAEADSPAVPHHHRCDAQHSTCSVQEGHGLIAWADPVERRAPQPAPAAAAFLPAAHARPFLLDGMARGIDRLGSRRRSASDLYLLTSRLLI